jgi:ferric-dicitrate binding protein FerR (iron transport regulator)
MNKDFSKYNDQEAYRIAMLIAAYVRGTITEKEHDELDNWVAASDDNLRLFERLTDEKNIEEATKWMETVATEKALQERKQGISFSKTDTPKMWVKFLPYAVAASLVIVAGLLFLNPFSKKSKVEDSPVVIMDIHPGSNKAILQLADGKKIILDSSANGDLLIQGNTTIIKSDGQIDYTGNQNAAGETLYNTVTTPKGGQYRLTLSDGSKVWLNAASSIRYPVVFTGNDRSVIITGEAYFEVAKNATKPFKVQVNDAVVEVLGTHFNINAYNDEPVIRTTLAEGSVKVTNSNNSTMLRPGEEAQIQQEGGIKTVTANLEETLAWKDGQFLFNDASIENIMRQVARWYDADIVYESKPTDHFNAEVARELPVSKLLHLLELTEKVHFKIEDKKIVVMK